LSERRALLLSWLVAEDLDVEEVLDGEVVVVVVAPVLRDGADELLLTRPGAWLCGAVAREVEEVVPLARMLLLRPSEEALTEGVAVARPGVLPPCARPGV
jgi:hypothetical protein